MESSVESLNKRTVLLSLSLPCLFLTLGCTRLGERHPFSEIRAVVLEESMRVKSAYFPEGYEDLGYSLLTFRAPPPQKKFPLIFLLHGRGGNGREYLEVWRQEAEKRKVMLLAPTRNRAYGSDPGDLDDFYKLIRGVIERYPVDEKKIYVAGVSSGAMVGEWLLRSNPSYWKGAVLVAAPSDSEWPTQADVGRYPPLLFVHGAGDEQFPIAGIEEYINVLSERGAKADLHRHAEGRHEHRPEWNPKIFDWMEET